MATPMRHQPQGATRVRSELTTGGRGIGFVLGPTRSDIFGGRSELAFFGAPEQVGSTQGYARKFVAARSTYARVTPPPGLIDLTGNFSVLIAFVLDVAGASTTSRIVHFSDTVANLNFQLVLISQKLCMVVGTSSSQFSVATSAASMVAGVPYVAEVGRGPDGFFMYLDGAPQVLGSNGAGGIANNIVSADINIGRRGDGASYFTGQVSLFSYQRGTFDSASRSANPWQLFEDENDVDQFTAAAAPPKSHTLAADPGTFALSGAAASLRARRTLATAAGEFTLFGAATGLRVARRIPGAAGEFALVGNPAVLRATRCLAAASASLVLAGTDVALRAARGLSASAGRFSMAGGAAQLIAARRLSAGSGSFAIVGPAALLVHAAAPAPGGPTYVLAATPGSFAVAGAPAPMVVSRRISSGAGQFAVSGPPAAIVALRRLIVAPGVFDIGAAATLLQVARRVPVGPGAFAVTGSNIVFKHSAQIEYARAPAGSGYTPRRYEYQSRPAQVSNDARPPAIQETYR